MGELVYDLGTWETGCEPIFMVFQMLVVLGIWESQSSAKGPPPPTNRPF